MFIRNLHGKNTLICCNNCSYDASLSLINQCIFPREFIALDDEKVIGPYFSGILFVGNHLMALGRDGVVAGTAPSTASTPRPDSVDARAHVLK
jgi:hypothetical protein